MRVAIASALLRQKSLSKKRIRQEAYKTRRTYLLALQITVSKEHKINSAKLIGCTPLGLIKTLACVVKHYYDTSRQRHMKSEKNDCI